MYYSAYKYITKPDTEVFHGDGHPDLFEIGSSRTKKSTKAYSQLKKEHMLRLNNNNLAASGLNSTKNQND